jgi:hypothetical protein
LIELLVVIAIITRAALSTRGAQTQIPINNSLCYPTTDSRKNRVAHQPFGRTLSDQALQTFLTSG